MRVHWKVEGQKSGKSREGQFHSRTIGQVAADPCPSHIPSVPDMPDLSPWLTFAALAHTSTHQYKCTCTSSQQIPCTLDYIYSALYLYFTFSWKQMCSHAYKLKENLNSEALLPAWFGSTFPLRGERLLNPAISFICCHWKHFFPVTAVSSEMTTLPFMRHEGLLDECKNDVNHMLQHSQSPEQLWQISGSRRRYHQNTKWLSIFCKGAVSSLQLCYRHLENHY